LIVYNGYMVSLSQQVFIVDLLEMKKIFTNIANSKNSRAAASAEEEE